MQHLKALAHAAKVETYPSVNRYIHGRRVQALEEKSFSGTAKHEALFGGVLK